MTVTKHTVFITGATGLLGSQLALQSLQRGCSLRLLVRSKNGMSAEERVKRVWDCLGATSFVNNVSVSIDIVEGDATATQFGLTQQEYRMAMSDVSTIFDCAGYVDFTDGSEEKFYKANMQSSIVAAAFAKDTNAKLHHISTAYIALSYSGIALESGSSNWGDTRNQYEYSKLQTEAFVREFCKDNAIRYSVYRPSILLASAKDGASLSFYNFNFFLRALIHCSAALQDEMEEVHLPLSPHDTLNVIPVDYAAEAIWAISQYNDSNAKTFHICNPQALTFERIRQVLESLCRIKIGFTPEGSSKQLSRHEKLLKGIVDRFDAYVHGEVSFSLQNTMRLLPDYVNAFPEMGHEYFHALISYAQRYQWGKYTWQENTNLNTPPVSEYAETYYSSFLGERLNTLLVDNLKSLNAVFQINLSDSALSNRILTIEQGRLTSILPSGKHPECTYITNCRTFEEITTAQRSPQNAFFDQDIEIIGDIEKGLQVATALSEFFDTHPFIPEEVQE